MLLPLLLQSTNTSSQNDLFKTNQIMSPPALNHSWLPITTHSPYLTILCPTILTQLIMLANMRFLNPAKYIPTSRSLHYTENAFPPQYS